MTGFKLRDPSVARKVLDTIRDLGQEIMVMHVCGTHQDTLVRYGLEPLLNEVGVRIRQGPGCPVCVTTGEEIELAIQLASSGKIVTSFGDIVKVPGKDRTLADIRSNGGDVRVVYSPDDALRIARENPDREVVFLGIGFETTAPTTSSLLLGDRTPHNLSILSYHRVVPPALKFIAQAGEVRLDGLIEPGHVSMVIGEEPYRFLSADHRIPQVIAGFEPLDLLMACLEIARQKAEGRAELRNMYGRVVKPEGNLAARKAMEETFEPCDVKWRGFPVIPGSGLAISERYDDHDARSRFQDELDEFLGLEIPEPEGCRCGDVLRGLIEPTDCPLFGDVCGPNHPIGPCMVSREGSCNILHRWGRNPV
ncbi:MAG: hydrogenase formation protein HypD [Candidatus Thermoplasmatota archaeon]|nr:hydrogenase formation protein HypD [Candidatus Thermoplasmatota archaeon]